MKNKRQSTIKRFLIREFGEQKGIFLFEKQELLFQTLIERSKGKSKSQLKTLTQTILPVVALYQVLAEFEPEEDAVFNIMRKYMIDIVAADKNLSMAKMEKVPGFFYIYRSIFLKVMRTSDLWESTQKCGEKCYDVTITKCLWHEACLTYGCPELCRLFCDVDDVTYGGLNKIGFHRTKTLGCGGDCCDFHFFMK
ncbi:MAG: L-2-amino-thiazoline-4-carboxylic acid hydrolase [Lachnospiraceae bacterium]|nr:L-2-amino-thiazoline-4-carboxylic acid hydrolase [Lachnospiraceae bacterium]MCM1233659.1 L-2-amino-thiazoline-4-carboxylic acid hydrolase [Ruminococcus flavefaciens]